MKPLISNYLSSIVGILLAHLLLSSISIKDVYGFISDVRYALPSKRNMHNEVGGITEVRTSFYLNIYTSIVDNRRTASRSFGRGLKLNFSYRDRHGRHRRRIHEGAHLDPITKSCLFAHGNTGSNESFHRLDEKGLSATPNSSLAKKRNGPIAAATATYENGKTFARRQVRKGGATNVNERKTSIQQLKRRSSTSQRKTATTNNGRSSRQVSSKQQKNVAPWHAVYRISKQTQFQIQQAARDNSIPSSADSNVEARQRQIHVAIRILQVLLVETPSTSCNDVNVMYALNLCAKTLLSNGRRHPQNFDHQKSKSNNKVTGISVKHKDIQTVDESTLLELFQLIAQLMEVVSKHMLHSNRLSFRQKANAAWSTANILTFVTEMVYTSIPSTVLLASPAGTKTKEESKTKSLNKTNEQIQQQLKQFLIDVGNSIRLDILERQSFLEQQGQKSSDTSVFQVPIQSGELSMILWAYATVWTTIHASSSTIITAASQSIKSSVEAAGETKPNDNEIPFSFEALNGHDDEIDMEISATEHAVQGDNEDEDNGTLNENIERCAVQLMNTIAKFILSEESAPSNCELSPPIFQEARWNELANMAWSFATIGANAGVDALEANATNSEHDCVEEDDFQKIDPFNRNENGGYIATIANLLNSLATEATTRLQLAEEATDAGKSVYLPDSFPLPRDISTIAWSLGTMTTQCPLWYFQMGDALQRLAHIIAVYELQHTTEPFRHWKSKDLVQLGVGLAHAAVADDVVDGQTNNRKNIAPLIPNLLKHLFTKATKQCHKFQTWELTILLWAQARLHLTRKMDKTYGNFVDRAVHTLWERVVSSRKSEVSSLSLLPPQEQANLAWSLVVLEEYHGNESRELLQYIFREAALSTRSNIQSINSMTKNQTAKKDSLSMLPEHAHQLWQALVVLRSEAPSILQSVKEVEPGSPFADSLKQCWLEEKARPKLSSYSHRKLSETLNNMRVAHLNEHDEDIDVAIVLKDSDTQNGSWTALSSTHLSSFDKESYPDSANNGRVPQQISPKNKVAVEYDGPTHFVRGGRRPLGHTVLKYRLLKQQGWTVVRVPHYEFDKIPMWASMERQRYLQRLLKTHPQLTFSDVDRSTYKVLTPNRVSRFD